MGSQGGQLSWDLPPHKEPGRLRKSLSHVGTLALGTEEVQIRFMARLSHLDVAAAGTGAIRKDSYKVKGHRRTYASHRQRRNVPALSTVCK